MSIVTGTRVAAIAAVAVGVFMNATLAFAQQVEVLWLGHATFRITSTTGKVIVIDPFLKKNPRTPAKYKDLAALGKVDLILVTHGHPDHVSDLPELASLTGAVVVANYELGNNLVALGLVDAPKVVALNKGGTVTPIGPAIKVHMVPAEHSSSVDLAVMKPESTGIKHARRWCSGRLRHRVRERIPDLSHGRHRRLRRHGADKPLPQTRPRVGMHWRIFHDGSGTRGLRTARIHQAQAGDPHALRDVSDASTARRPNSRPRSATLRSK